MSFTSAVIVSIIAGISESKRRVFNAFLAITLFKIVIVAIEITKIKINTMISLLLIDSFFFISFPFKMILTNSTNYSC